MRAVCYGRHLRIFSCVALGNLWVDHAFKMGRKSPFTLLPEMRRSPSLDQKAQLHQAIYPSEGSVNRHSTIAAAPIDFSFRAAVSGWACRPAAPLNLVEK